MTKKNLLRYEFESETLESELSQDADTPDNQRIGIYSEETIYTDDNRGPEEG